MGVTGFGGDWLLGHVLGKLLAAAFGFVASGARGRRLRFPFAGDDLEWGRGSCVCAWCLVWASFSRGCVGLGLVSASFASRGALGAWGMRDAGGSAGRWAMGAWLCGLARSRLPGGALGPSVIHSVPAGRPVGRAGAPNLRGSPAT